MNTATVTFFAEVARVYEGQSLDAQSIQEARSGEYCSESINPMDLVHKSPARIYP